MVLETMTQTVVSHGAVKATGLNTSWYVCAKSTSVIKAQNTDH